MSELGRAEELERAVEGISIENASWYLATFGDAWEARIRKLIEEAKVLSQSGHSGPSLVLCATSLELTVRYFVLKPLIAGTFLKDTWVDLLVDKLVPGQSRRDRDLLRPIADEYGIDFNAIVMSDNRVAWSFYESEVIPKRNNFIHKGAPVSPELSARAVECAEALFSNLLTIVATKFELSWAETGVWHQVVQGKGAGQRFAFYKPVDDLE